MTLHFTNPQTSRSPMFFLHSSASNGSQWDAFAEVFGGDREVFTPNLLGYGPVLGKVDESSAGMARLASPIIAQIEAQQRPVHLVGHSFGGAVALHIALNRPELVESLAIYEPASFHILQMGTPEQIEAFAEIENLANTLAVSINADCRSAGMERFIDFWNGAGCWDRFSENKRNIMSSLAATVLSNFDDGKQEQWTLADLNQLQVPTLMMEGRRSPSASRHVADIIASAIPGAMFASFEELGHMAPAFSPEKIFPVIRDHISITEKSVMDQVWPLQSAA